MLTSKRTRSGPVANKVPPPFQGTCDALTHHDVPDCLFDKAKVKEVGVLKYLKMKQEGAARKLQP